MNHPYEPAAQIAERAADRFLIGYMKGTAIGISAWNAFHKIAQEIRALPHPPERVLPVFTAEDIGEYEHGYAARHSVEGFRHLHIAACINNRIAASGFAQSEPGASAEHTSEILSENARLHKALSVAWEHAKMMRSSSTLVGPHTDPKQNAVWKRALYREGKDLMKKLKPYRDENHPKPEFYNGSFENVGVQSEPVDMAITLEEFAAQCFRRGDASDDGLYPVDLEKMQEAFQKAFSDFQDDQNEHPFFRVAAKYLAAEGFRLGDANETPIFDKKHPRFMAGYIAGLNDNDLENAANVQASIDAAVLAERQACAEIVQHLAVPPGLIAVEIKLDAANAIRARTTDAEITQPPRDDAAVGNPPPGAEGADDQAELLLQRVTVLEYALLEVASRVHPLPRWGGKVGQVLTESRKNGWEGTGK